MNTETDAQPMIPRPLKIVFLGSDAIARPLLEWLAGEGRTVGEVVGVFTQPDRPTGRGQKVVPNAIKSWAVARHIPVLQPERLSEAERTQLEEFQPDLSLVMAYGHILRDEFIATPRLGTLNLHTSILPKYRGASPIQTAIASGERETGVTLMQIVRRLDAGPLADVERVAIGAAETALEVETKLSAACVPLLQRSLPALQDGTLRFAPQDDSAATFCRKLTKEDGVLDFSRPAAELAARINGLFPWPACTVELAGQPLKLGAARADGDPRRSGECHLIRDMVAPGTVVGTDADALLVQSGDGILRVLRLQRPGGRMLPASEFLRGFPLATGTRLPSAPMPPLVSSVPFRK